MEKIVETWGREVKENLKERNFSGGFAVGYDGKKVFSYCAGYADYENKLKFSEDVSFGIGSVTKQFTAFSILKLVSEGKISLEDTIDKYLPEYKYAGQIQIIDLLQMGAGIVDYIYGVLYKDIDWENDSNLAVKQKMWRLGEKNYSYSEILDMVNEYPLNEEVSRKMVYSNTNYVFLQEIIERVEKIPLKEYFRLNIFEPLEMYETVLGSENAKANSYYISDGRCYVVGKGYNANGECGVVSTLNDILRWLAAVEEEEYLPNNLWDIMFQPKKRNYGVAWYKLKNWFYHCGDSMGYRVQVCISKRYNVQIVFGGNCCEDSIDGGFFEKIASYISHLDIMLSKEEMKGKLIKDKIQRIVV